MKIEMTAAEASDILDDLGRLDGMWEPTYKLRGQLEAIEIASQPIYATPEELNRRWYLEGYPE